MLAHVGQGGVISQRCISVAAARLAPVISQQLFMDQGLLPAA
jgi:hypothetical protein